MKEAARKLRVAASTISRWVKEGIIEAIRLPGGSYWIRKTAIEAIIKPKDGKNSDQKS